MNNAKALILALFATGSLYAQPFITNVNGIDIVNTADIYANGEWQNTGSFVNNGSVTLTDNWINLGAFVNNGMVAYSGNATNSGSFENNGSVTLTNNWANLGTYEAAGTGKMVLDYATDKTFNHNNQSVRTLQKTGFGNLLLTGTLSVIDSLLLQNGLIVNSDTLTLSPAVVIQSAPNSFVTGKLTHLGSGDKFFPIGLGANATAVTVTAITGAAPKVTASVEAAPAYTAGAGVDQLIGFPVAWRINASAQTDTASYLRLSFNQNIIAVPDWNSAVATRDNGSNQFEGMGKRNVSNMNGILTLTSYSKGLRGLFSIANGFAGNLETDSLTLVNFYNQTGASAWTKDNNWLTGSIATWQGVTETGGSITSLVLDAANITGPMNEGVAEITSLVTVNVAGNNITSIPDFTDLTALTSLNVSNNRLDFASLEENATLGPIINYTNQKVIETSDTVLVPVGDNYQLVTQVGGTQNVYTWKRNATVVAGAIDSLYTIAAIGRGNMGTYEAEITNPLVSGLTLRTAPQEVLAVATLSGTLSMDATTPATAGTMRLLKVTAGSGYDTTQVVPIGTTGAYTFSNVILDDYQIVGFADTLVAGQDRALPTYYQGTLYWEEADTLFVNESRDDLNIISQLEPSAPLLGDGVIAGIVEEDDGLGGRGLGTKRVGGAGVSARRTQGTGRGAEVLELVAYVYTNEEGEFSIDGLVPGTYRLNIQYPGFPMDVESDIDLTIGTSPLDEVVSVEATVAEGKIAVRKLIVTGLYEERAYKAEVFPNPAVEMVQFEFEKTSEKRELVLLDAAGKPVKQQAAPEQRGTMIVKELPLGTYLLQVRDGDKVRKVVRVVIE